MISFMFWMEQAALKLKAIYFEGCAECCAVRWVVGGSYLIASEAHWIFRV